MLRRYFRDNPSSRLWRVVFMLAIATMLIVALLPTGQWEWTPDTINIDYRTLGGVPALCFMRQISSEDAYQARGGSGQLSSVIISVLVLCFGYMNRLIKMSENASRIRRRWFRSIPAEKWKRLMASCDQTDSSNPRKAPIILVSIMLQAIYVYLHACYEIYESMLWEVSLTEV